MPFLHSNSIKIYYEQHGAGDDLVLIGGLSSDHNVWKSTVRLFSKYYRVLIFDNRGAGQSDAPNNDYTTDMMATDTLQLMDALYIKRAHVVGHSMGGCIAQKMAIIAPKKINTLTLACSRGRPNKIANMILSMREKLQTIGVTEELIAEYIMPFLFSEDFLNQALQVKGFIQWTLQNPFPQSAAGFRHQFNAVAKHTIDDQLDKLTGPTLVIAGEEDILMPAIQAKLLADSLPNSTYVEIPQCAHMPHVEKSREFAQIVLDFLQKN